MTEFELFGQTWQPRADVSAGEWWKWAELPGMGARVEALKAMFVDPSWEAFMDAVPVREFDAALLELWAAVRTPPAEKNG